VNITRRVTLSLLSAVSLFVASEAAAQNWQAAPTFGTATLSAGFMPDPHTTLVQAGGSDEVALVDPSCTGYINESAPDLDLNYVSGGSDLFIYARGDADVTLLVLDPSGEWHCNDDWEGTDPLVAFFNPEDGNYNIWVGTFFPGELEPVQVMISEIDPGSDGISAELPDFSAPPVYETLTLSAGFAPDPQTWPLDAGGSDPNPIEGADCRGFINLAAPDFDLNYSAGSLPLYISARANADLTLLVNDPNGTWHCSDDENGTNPGIVFSKPLSGNYNIWVGTFSPGGLEDAVLQISERGFVVK